MAGHPRERLVSPYFRFGFPVAAAAVLAAILVAVLPPGEATEWMFHPAAVAGVAFAGLLWYAVRSLRATAPAGSPWRSLFGLANAVTLVRGGLYAVVAGFVVVPPWTDLVWVPAVCYGVGAALDRVDGAVARTMGRQTELGTRLDMAFDTFGFVVAPLVGVLWGRLPAVYLSLSAARYVYRGALSYRRRRGRPVYDRPDSDLGKYLAGVQMAFLTVALVPAAPAGTVRTVAPLVLAPSLAVFLRDYLVASGRLAWGRDGED